MRIENELFSPAAEVDKGVDWKSLTIPASLPITTDYFPGLKVLKEEYGQNDYVLKPKEIQSDMKPSPIKGTQINFALDSQLLKFSKAKLFCSWKM